MKDREAKTGAQLGFHRKGRKARKRHDHRMVHKLIRKVAWEMAAAYYEHAAHDNEFYHYFPSQMFFCDYEWQRFIELAKNALRDMLGNPMTPEAYKIDIHEALVLDATLPYSVQEMQIPTVKH
jgi:hypothetical protein